MRANIFISFFAALALVVLAAGGCQPDRRELLEPCPPEDPECMAACSEAEGLAVFRQRIEPLLDESRPSSCNSCHLTGIPLDSFVRDTPCQSMACLLDKELVDFADVERSLILTWIEQGQPHPEMQGAAQAEYEGFRAWIAYSARCHAAVCGQIAEPCGPPLDAGPRLPDAAPVDMAVDMAPDSVADAGPGAADAGPGAVDAALPDADLDAAVDAVLDLGPDAGPPDAAPPIDDGPCGPETRLTLFHDHVMSWQGRCEHCHTADGITAGVGGAPIWMVDDETREAAAATMASVIERGYVDLEAPDQSLILLKPLHRGHGGVRHGGGNKFLSQEDPAYLDFRTWVERHARCETGAPLDWGMPAPDAVEDAALPDAAVDAALPDAALPDAAFADAADGEGP